MQTFIHPICIFKYIEYIIIFRKRLALNCTTPLGYGQICKSSLNTSPPCNDYSARLYAIFATTQFAKPNIKIIR